MTNKSANVDLDDETLDRVEIVDVLARDFLARFRAGDRPSIDDYAQRHPDLAADIRRMFPLVASVEKLKIDDQESVDGRATLAGRELERLGDFRIIREIGRGGMGIVYEAEQETLGRRVAIKVLPKQCLLEDHELARFHQEARTAASMHHSNIVPIYGTGDFEGSHYLVMQLVEGESLEERLAKQQAPFSTSQTARIGKQVADAIAYAHENGVLHRDIKPANILIDVDGTPQVTDFGLATNINDRDPTKSRTISGSLRYMAPERFRGVSQPKSDVYSIGLTLYEMLVGKPAFEQTDASELLAVLVSPPTQSIKKHRPDVPVDIETIVLKAMNAEPEKRYKDAAELSADLQRFLSNEPIKARRISLLQKALRWCRRDPKTAFASAIAVAALVTATIASSAAYFVAAAANERTTSALNSSEEITNLALETLNEVVDGISLAPSTSQLGIADEGLIDLEQSSADPFASASPHTAQVLESLQPLYEGLLEQAPTRPDIVRQMVDASVQHARILNQLGNTNEAITTIQRGISLLESHSEDAQMPIEETSVKLMRLHNELGLYYTAAYRFDEADASHRKVISTSDSNPTSDADRLLELARANVFLGDLSPSRRRDRATNKNRKEQIHHLDQALELLKHLESDQELNSKKIVVDILNARCYLGLSRLVPIRTGRIANFDSAIKILESRLADTPKAIAIRFELVKALSDQNLRGALSDHQIQNATNRLAKSLAYIHSLREEFPKNPVFSVGEIHIRHKLSSLAKKCGDFSDADANIEVAIEIQSNLIESYPESISHRCWRALLFRSLAESMRAQNQIEESNAAIESAQRDIENIPENASDHPFVVRVRKTVSEFSTASPEL